MLDESLSRIQACCMDYDLHPIFADWCDLINQVRPLGH